MYSSTAIETARDTIRNTHSIIVLDSDHEEESTSSEHDDGAIVQIIMHTEDSAEEQDTDMEDHNCSLNMFSNIELERGNTTNAMLLSDGSDQPINASESEVQSASHGESDVALNIQGDTSLLSNSTESGNQSVVSSGDFGKLVQLRTQFSDQQKYFLLKKHFVPSCNYEFPTREMNKLQRHFQYSWLKRYPGLVYSESQNGGYCKYCFLFAKCEPSVKDLGAFVNSPFTNFKRASEILGQHFHGLGNAKGNKTHQNAIQDANMFLKTWKTVLPELITN